MKHPSESSPILAQHAARDAGCPSCNGPVFRIHRRSFDRFVNFFMPVYRYRCGSMGCDWEGNLQSQQHLPQKQPMNSASL
jgi:hypothetical protein